MSLVIATVPSSFDLANKTDSVVLCLLAKRKSIVREELISELFKVWENPTKLWP